MRGGVERSHHKGAIIVRRLITFLFVLGLAGCNGGGSTAPSFSTGIAAPSSLYVASWDRVNVFSTAGGPMQRQITSVGYYHQGVVPGCSQGCSEQTLVAIAARSDGTLVAGAVQGPHAPQFLFSIYDRGAAGAATPISTYGIGRSMGHHIVPLPGSAQYAVLGYLGVEVYAGSGDPARSFQPAYANLQDLAVDRSGNFYVASYSSKLVAVYAPGSTGTPAPMRTISTGALLPTNLAVGPDGTLFVGAMDQIAVFPPGSAAADHVLGPFVKDGASEQIAALAVDAQGELFVGLNRIGHNRVVVFEPGSSTPARALDDPIAQTTGSTGFVDDIVSIAVGP